MKNLNDIEARHSEHFQEMTKWALDRYNEVFSQFFENQREIGKRLNSSSSPITDEELEKVLIDVPLVLIDVSEVLNLYKLRIEALKLSIKERSLESDRADFDTTVLDSLEDKLLISAYESVIHRVEKEMSYTRELIMGAKKVWDSRRHTDDAVPIAPVDTDPLAGLPEYKKQAYIR